MLSMHTENVNNCEILFVMDTNERSIWLQILKIIIFTIKAEWYYTSNTHLSIVFQMLSRFVIILYFRNVYEQSLMKLYNYIYRFMWKSIYNFYKNEYLNKTKTLQRPSFFFGLQTRMWQNASNTTILF